MSTTILGIETSCDETSLALVKDGTVVLSSLLSSSQDLHIKTLGIVPEVAAREQLKYIIPLLEELSSFNIENINGVAVTYGPGLIGSLLVGLETAKTLSWLWGKPLYRVNHLLAHFYAAFLEKDNSSLPKFPCLFLLVSGGHSDLVLFKDHGYYQYLGGTRDDAAGEAFDKAARLLGLPYPGGPAISQLASQASGASWGEPLPRPLARSKDYDFSFSGLKTALRRKIDITPQPLSKEITAALALDFENSVVESLMIKVEKALIEFSPSSLIVGGGVSANTNLREMCVKSAEKYQIKLFLPALKYCTDNAAMVAGAAYFTKDLANPLTLQPNPSLSF